MGIFKKAVVAAVGAAVSYYVTKVVTDMLEERSLPDRIDDAKDAYGQAKVSALDKAGTAVTATKDSVNQLIMLLEKYVEDKKSDAA